MDTTDKRLLSIKEVCKYTGLGKTNARIWLEDIGAVVMIGRRVFGDRFMIDKFISDFHEKKEAV